MGFGHSRVQDRYHDIGHSDYLTGVFASAFWLPFLEQGIITPGLRRRPKEPWWVSALVILPIKYVLLLAVLLLSIGRVIPHIHS
jgi:hypothetical protein